LNTEQNKSADRLNLDIPMSPAMKRAFEKPTDSPDPSIY
jgi:glutamate/aspartate transport system substrate-binding protein